MRGITRGVIRAFLVLAGLVVSVFAFAASSAQAAGPVQALGIVLQSDTAATERLPHYRAATPIAVNVGRLYPPFTRRYRDRASAPAARR